ncbi:MAG TPA: carboxypeptidase-like regulatory domain-containing protein, partial [Steroidobacteraceae bacterium]|nr:carboxypeptidase-like regulatory domain-containing protein [Steroidobacteraceae bacterium]
MLLLALASPVRASVFADVRGVVHDPQHRPVSGANVNLQADNSSFNLRAATNSNGEFAFTEVPLGSYRISIQAPGFAAAVQSIVVASGTHAVLHIPLELAASTQTVTVHADGASAALDTATPTTLITHDEIEDTPGASRTL